MANFRSSFVRTGKAVNWFPKHMNTGLRQMQAKLRTVDCVIEVHDSRIPMSGRNPTFYENFIGNKPHLLLMNKCDLVSKSDREKIQQYYSNGPDVLFTNCKNDQDRGIKQIVSVMKHKIESSERFDRTGNKEYHGMIIGIPNVGKSSLINALRSKYLRKGRALRVGPSAGVTKMVHEKVRISESPLIFLFDTPGVLTPRISDSMTGMKLAACGNLPDKNVGITVIADFILFTMNRKRNFKYLKFFKLDEPTDCITTLLGKGALNLGYQQKIRSMVNNEYQIKPDLNLAATKFVDAFRSGEFGPIIFDKFSQHEEILENDMRGSSGSEFASS